MSDFVIETSQATLDDNKTIINGFIVEIIFRPFMAGFKFQTVIYKGDTSKKTRIASRTSFTLVEAIHIKDTYLFRVRLSKTMPKRFEAKTLEEWFSIK